MTPTQRTLLLASWGLSLPEGDLPLDLPPLLLRRACTGAVCARCLREGDCVTDLSSTPGEPCPVCAQRDRG